MSHFARVNKDNVVIDVIVAELPFIISGFVGNPGEWLQTSYNTIGGVHTQGGTPLRKNFAGVGFTYDPIRDAFIPPKPNEDCTLIEESCLWFDPHAPVPNN